MKTRILSALVGVVLLLGAVFCPYTEVFALLLAAVAALAVWELLHNTGLVRCRLLIAAAMGYTVLRVSWMFLHGLFGQTGGAPAADTGRGAVLRALYDGLTPLMSGELAPLLLVFGLVTALLLIAQHGTLSAGSAGFAVAASLYVACGFGALAAMRATQDGLFYLFLTLVIAWMSDTGAYFVGTFFGRHKMTPVISPKKSWEGFFGGWAVAVGAAVLTGVIYQACVPSASVNLWASTLTAFLLAPLSFCGDLLASVVKRQTGIKDYGRIMPGHGGVMDRFDSVVIITPVLWVLHTLLPLVA